MVLFVYSPAGFSQLPFDFQDAEPEEWQQPMPAEQEKAPPPLEPIPVLPMMEETPYPPIDIKDPAEIERLRKRFEAEYPFPETVKEVTEESEPPLDPELVEPLWEEDFREDGLTLWQCINLALQNNRPLRNAREDLRIAQINAQESLDEFGNIYYLGGGVHYDEKLRDLSSPIRNDRYYFNFGGSGTGVAGGPSGTFMTRKFPSGGRVSLGANSIFLPPGLTDDLRWFSEANLILSQPLLEGAGGVATIGLQIDQIERNRANLNLERQIQELITNVVDAYLNVQLRISLVEVQQNSYLRAIEQYSRSFRKSKNPASGVTPLEMVRSKQQVTSNKQQFIDTKNQYRSSLITLRLTLGLEPSTNIILSGTEIPTVNIPDITIDEAIEFGLKMRPDLRSIRLLKSQNELLVKQAQNQMLPNLDFSARMNLTDEGHKYPESWGMFSYEDAAADLSLGIPLNLPSDKANYQRSQARLRQAKNTIEQQERVVVNQIDERFREQMTLRERIEVLRLNEELAKQTYQILQGLSEFENIDPFDIVKAQDDWTQAAAQRVQAEIRYVVSIANLDLAMGRPISELFSRYLPPNEAVPSP